MIALFWPRVGLTTRFRLAGRFAATFFAVTFFLAEDLTGDFLGVTRLASFLAVETLPIRVSFFLDFPDFVLGFALTFAAARRGLALRSRPATRG